MSASACCAYIEAPFIKLSRYTFHRVCHIENTTPFPAQLIDTITIMTSPSQATVTINERVTGPPGAEMLRQANISQKSNVEVLDLACGGGIISSSLLDDTSLTIKRIVAGDIDDQMLAYVTDKRNVALKSDSDSAWSLVEVQKMNQASIPLSDATFDYVFNNFGIFFNPDDNTTLTETLRILKPEGTAGLTSWKAITWWSEVTAPALAQYLPDAPELPAPGGQFPPFGWTDPDAISTKLEKAGFRDVRVSEFTFKPKVEAEPFGKATGFLVQGIAKRAWSEGDFEKYGSQIEGTLVRYLKEKFHDGVWDGDMTAIITLGKK
jgi:ubiquinone/menaquinone biosynthesis C-methylase UbiE